MSDRTTRSGALPTQLPYLHAKLAVPVPCPFRVMATKHDALPKQADERLITDIDLSILGRDEPVYDRYEAAIREEYSWVPWDVYRSKRIEVLESFLARERIYSTRWFFDRYESQARQNLRRAIDALNSHGQ